MESNNVLAFLAILGLSVAFTNPQFRIAGGKVANPHAFPYVVSLKRNELVKHNCGGSILSERWILTAGHCIDSYKGVDYKILAGKHDLDVDEPGQQIRYGAKFILHPKYDPHQLGPNDIGLVYLSEPLIFSKTVQPLALPKQNTIPNGPAIVSGWGRTSYTHIPSRLQTAIVPILEHKICAALLKHISTYDETILCSGTLSGKVGPCRGDSGGPLVQEIDEKMTVVGVISWANILCHSPKTPPAYMRVSHFVSWIIEEMAKV